MPDLAFLVFENEKDCKKVRSKPGLLFKSGFLKSRIGTALLYLFNKKKLFNGISSFNIEPGIDVLIISLPFSIKTLFSLNIKYVERYVSRICSARGCEKCFVPAAAKKTGGFEQYSMNENSRHIVFKALLVPMLDVIYSNRGFSIDSLDTAIVSGENAVDLSTVVKQMEPFMKYMNVAASDKQAVEDALADICAESGISIFVSSDFKGILRNSELIINLGKMSELLKYRIKPKTLVLNFDESESLSIRGEFIVITGVVYSFPLNQYNIFGEDIQQSFSKSELSEILMIVKAGLLNGGSYNDATVGEVLKVFKNSGCKLTGFNGRRGVLRVENIIKM